MAQRAPDSRAPRVGILDWDTEFFGFRVGRVLDTELTCDGAREVAAWARREAVACVYFLAGDGDSQSAHAAERVGFRLMDVRVELGLSLRDEHPRAERTGGNTELAKPEDVSALCDIAAASHRDTRFWADPRFPRERCAALYARWIDRSCAGEADAVLIARLEGRAAAYVTCHLEGDDVEDLSVGRIGLVAVTERARGRSVGGGLVASAVEWFESNGADRVRVVTQGRNAVAARLYERAGFRTQRVGLWFHLWPPECGESGA